MSTISSIISAYYMDKQLKNKKSNFNSLKPKSNTKSKGKVSYSASKDLAKLAAAETKAQVVGIKGLLRAQIGIIKSSSAPSEEIKEAIRKIKKVISKADAKIKNLTKEKEIENRKRIAQSTENKKEEIQLYNELNKRIKKRKFRELNDILEEQQNESREAKNGSTINLSGNSEFSELMDSAVNLNSDISIEVSSADADVCASDSGGVELDIMA